MSTIEHFWPAPDGINHNVGVINNKLIILGTYEFSVKDLNSENYAFYNLIGGDTGNIALITTNSPNPIKYNNKLYFVCRYTGPFSSTYWAIGWVDEFGNSGTLSSTHISSNNAYDNKALSIFEDDLYLRDKKINITNNTMSSLNVTPSGKMGVLNNQLWGIYDGSVVRFDPSDCSILEGPYGSGMVSDINCYVDTDNDLIYWRTNLGFNGFDVNTKQIFKTLMSPPTNVNYPRSILGSDGLVYMLESNTSILVCDAITGRWKQKSLADAPARDRRSIFEYNTRVFLSSEKPSSWD